MKFYSKLHSSILASSIEDLTEKNENLILLNDEQIMLETIISMCSPFHYTSKQYYQIRQLLIDYCDELNKVLEEVLVTEYIPDHEATNCILLHKILKKLIHAFKRSQKYKKVNKKYIKGFCEHQKYLIETKNWQFLNQTQKLLYQCLPQVNEYSCPICLNILKNPVSLDVCQHKYCKQCIDEMIYKEEGDYRHINCPICRCKNKISKIKEDPALNNFIHRYFPIYIPWWSRLYQYLKSFFEYLLQPNICYPSHIYNSYGQEQPYFFVIY
ncbi:unnamed protein product [Cunninghamella blakesleeana]